LEGQKLTLTFSSEFQHASLNSPEKKDLLAKVIEKVTGQQLRIECELKAAQQASPEKKDDSPLSQALSIFPGSEVL
jgi:lipid II:glycine glycyltransferase (peptidoglycan interpeptide bridge formation enzyme)